MLYRKYRPQVFSDIAGQAHIVKTLSGALTGKRIGHAYLFCGPRGTGKTTIARIFAKAVNCDQYLLYEKGENKDISNVPCSICESCLAITQNRSLDIVEIDAASNRGIDEIRSLKESALVASLGGRKKVFIIDEVHMLTKDAFNALLKILEEPPSHVLFILATTEAHKIIPTVLSRVQRFDFHRLSEETIHEKLRKIVHSENIAISNDGLETISRAADGALRDAEVLLTKIQSINGASANELNGEDVARMLGIVPVSFYDKFFRALAEKNSKECLDIINEIFEFGLDIEQFVGSFLSYSRSILLSKAGTDDQTDYKEIKKMGEMVDQNRLIIIITRLTLARSQMKYAPVTQLPLEIAVLELCS